MLIDVPIDIVNSNSDINSIDEASEKLDKSLESKSGGPIPPETEFWGHCSNIQVWVENNYDIQNLKNLRDFKISGYYPVYNDLSGLYVSYVRSV